MSFTVRKQAAFYQMSDEAMIDAGIATPEIIARSEAREADAHARWMAHPIWRRAWLTLRYRLRFYEQRRRIAHAVRALRGIECEE